MITEIKIEPSARIVFSITLEFAPGTTYDQARSSVDRLNCKIDSLVDDLINEEDAIISYEIEQ